MRFGKEIIIKMYPDKDQINDMDNTLRKCLFLYNYFLRKKREKSISRYDQNLMIKDLKIKYRSLQEVYTQVLYDVSMRVHFDFKNYIAKTITGRNPNYPKKKTLNEYRSFTYPEYGFKITDGEVYLSRIGLINIDKSVKIKYIIKRCTIEKQTNNTWFLVLNYNF